MKLSIIVMAVVVAIMVSTITGAPSSSSTKIVGGQFAEEHQFPHQVALFYKGNFLCGGSIIDTKWILTAAHCVTDGVTVFAPEDFAVYVGSPVLDDEKGEFFTVAETFPHEEYGESKNDVALLKLNDELDFSESVNKIDLFDGELEHGDEVVISGFGREGTELPASEHLKYNTMYVQDDEVCTMVQASTGEGVICLNNAENNGACMGDSGGPAVFQGKLVGVANFVLNACGTFYPDGYAKVAFYRDWISGVMEQ